MGQKHIPGHPGYTARSDGLIFGKRRGYALHQSIDKFGRPTVSILTNGVYRKYLVSQLIAETFLPNPNGCEFVLHIDGNVLNNNVGNLKWTTIIK